MVIKNLEDQRYLFLLNDIEMVSFFLGQFQFPTRRYHYYTCFGGWAKLAIQGHSLWQEGWCDYWTGHSPQGSSKLFPVIQRLQDGSRPPGSHVLQICHVQTGAGPRFILSCETCRYCFAFNHMTYEIMVLEISERENRTGYPRNREACDKD